MQHKLSNPLPPLVFNALLWLCGITLLLMLKTMIARLSGAIDDDWMELDLALALSAYVLFFLLEPMRTRIIRHLGKRARRREKRYRS